MRDKVTGKPVPGVRINAFADLPPALTDQDGHYELLGCPKAQSYSIRAQPQSDQPYFAADAWVVDGPGLDPLTLNLELVSGIPVHGEALDRLLADVRGGQSDYLLTLLVTAHLLPHGIGATSAL